MFLEPVVRRAARVRRGRDADLRGAEAARRAGRARHGRRDGAGTSSPGRATWRSSWPATAARSCPRCAPALEAGLPYVGLVASRRRGQGVIGELRSDGVPDELLARIDTPAGLDIGARTPEEIAVSILARIIEVRRGSRAAADRGRPDLRDDRHGDRPARSRSSTRARRSTSAPRAAGGPSRRSTTMPERADVCGLVLGAGGSQAARAPEAAAALPRRHAARPRRRRGVRVRVRPDDRGASAARRRTCSRHVDLGGVEVVVNDAYGEGCSSSIAAALARGGRPRPRCCVLMLGDQPGVTRGRPCARCSPAAATRRWRCAATTTGAATRSRSRARCSATLANLHGDKGVWKLLDRAPPTSSRCRSPARSRSTSTRRRTTRRSCALAAA